VDLIAMAHHIGGDQRAAATNFDRSVTLFGTADDRRGLANALGLLALASGSFHVAATTPFMSAAVPDELRAPQSLRLAREIGWRDGIVLVPLVLCILGLALYPQLILKRTDESVQQSIAAVQPKQRLADAVHYSPEWTGYGPRVADER